MLQALQQSETEWLTRTHVRFMREDLRCLGDCGQQSPNFMWTWVSAPDSSIVSEHLLPQGYCGQYQGNTRRTYGRAVVQTPRSGRWDSPDSYE